jgi:drug/metabolite transporter (DMT)-like permease
MLPRMERFSLYLRVVLTTLIWATVFHLGADVVTFMHPLAVAAWRFGVGALGLCPLVMWRETWSWRDVRRNAAGLFGMAVTGVFIFNVAMFYGLRNTSALNAALIMALSPAITTVIGAAIDRRPIDARQWIGLVLGVLGVSCVVTGGSWQVFWHLQLSPGDAFMLLASFSWSIFALIPPRWVRGLDALQMTAASTAIGALLLIVVAGLFTTAPWHVPAWPVGLALVYMGLIGTTLALTWWNQGVRRLGSAQATLFLNLTPIFAGIIAVFRGQPLHWSHFAGAALVIAGVLLACGWGHGHAAQASRVT